MGAPANELIKLRSLTVESNTMSRKQSLWRDTNSIASSKWPCKIRPEE